MITFRSGFWLLQASILHQLKGKSHIVNLLMQNQKWISLNRQGSSHFEPQGLLCFLHLLLKALWGEEEVVQRDKVVLQQPHQQNQVNSICKLATNTKTA